MLAGVPVHIVHRGNNRQACFREPEDRSFYLLHLTRLRADAACAVHAYCLMTNHVHLLVTATQTDGCARLMKGIAQLHTQYMNRKYERTGSLWEGRFRSCLVQSENYLLACYRYIETNPIRAGLCQHPGDHIWSSYAANGDGAFDPLVTSHEEYMCLGAGGASRQAAYRDLFESKFPEQRVAEIRKATNGNFALGDPSFQRRIEAALGRRVAPASPGRPARAKPDDELQLDLIQ